MAADGQAFVLVEGDHRLGAALAWSRRAGATEVHVIADEESGVLARQAGEFATAVHVWRTSGRDLVAAEAAAVDPGVGPPDAPDLVALIESEGLDVVVEGDRLAGEFRGLEVVRVVRALDDGAPILEVGVGKYDRALTAMMHGDLDGRSSIARAVEQLRLIRRPDGPPNHPLATLVPERWLRTTLIADPALIGCDELVAAPAAEPRDRLRPRGVAAATGTRDGEDVVVVCTVGVDLEAVVLAADTRLMVDADARLLLAMPARDVLPTVEAMVADLCRPAEIVPVEGDWRR
jgi:dipeptidyl aminopeptidase/acylaminoacyl peptidase